MSIRSLSHRHTQLVEAAPEVVWALACDVPRYPDWVAVTLEMVDATSEATAGSTYVERTRVVGPITVVSHWTVVERDDLACFTRHECRDEPGPVKGMWLEMRATREGAGTRFDLSIGCRVEAGILTGPVAAALSRQLRKGNAGNIERFAALAEGLAIARLAD